jgi:hypothetical protein
MRASTWIVCFLLLSGCDALDFAIGRSSSFTAQPSALSACGSSAVVRLSWNTRPSGQQNVAIFVRQGDEEKLFAHGGPEGSQETGPWVRPNTVFMLRSRDSSRELARLVVGSENCDPVTFEAQPAKVSACTPGAIVRLSWNARTSAPQGVAIFMRQGDEEKLFAHGGPEGSQETGPWVGPNTVFTLRSRDDGRELAHFTVGSESCGPTTFDPVTFDVQPATLSACTPGAIVRLSWDVRNSGHQGVALYLRQRDEEKLFAYGGPEGSQETGPWVRPNSVLTLRSRDGSRKLASLIVGFERCDPTGKNRRLGER